MKRTLLLMVAVIATVTSFAQVPRNMVILEVATGTWCVWCPGAANAADQLVAEGKSVAVIENHNGDVFAYSGSDARNTYYNISGYPTGRFDGTLSYVGGAQCPNGTVYGSYLPLYNQEINTPSPLSICLSGTNVGNDYTIHITLKKVAAITGTDLRLHLVVTETNIPYNWQSCMTECDYVNRAMVPTSNGTSFSFGSGDVQNFTLNFTKDPSWVLSNCELVAFVQDYPSKTIYNGCKASLSSLPSAMMTLTDFTGSPTSGCTPLSVGFSASGTGITTYAWTCPGGTPNSSTGATPTIVYNDGGTYNVSLVATNGVCKDSIGKTGYINAIASAGTASQPVGNTGMCVNPPDQTYTTTSLPNVTTYIWDLQPPSAGALTPSGTSCVVNFDDAFSGVANLKVKGSNSCGDGPWSLPLDITVSTVPGTPGTPSGPTEACQGTTSSYTTSGTTPATSYTWELTPSTAGALTASGTSASVNWSITFSGTAQIHVRGVNGTCEGPWSANLVVTVNYNPATFNVTGGGTYCAIGGTGLPVGLDGSQTGADYTLYLNGNPIGSPVPGSGYPITFGNQMDAGTYAVIGAYSATSCSNTMNGQAIITIDPQAPEAPGTPSGPSTVTAGNSSDYTTTGGTYAASYIWQVTPPEAGIFSGSGTTGTIAWDNSYEGSAYVKVVGVNTCGNGDFSQETPVIVLPSTTGIQEPGKQKIANIYPNPAHDFINLVPVKTVKASIKVLNSVGAVVIRQENVNLNGIYRINIEQLAPGVYFFSIISDDLQQIQKVVIN